MADMFFILIYLGGVNALADASQSLLRIFAWPYYAGRSIAMQLALHDAGIKGEE
jgi:hypothetical protein